MAGRRLFWVAMLAIAGSLCWVGQASAYVYWTNDRGGIGRANLDGTNPTQFFIPSADAPEPTGVAVDGQHIYWADRSGGIGRANLDGTNPTQFFIPSWTSSPAAPEPLGVAVDGQHIYWADWVGGVGRANLDGSNVTYELISVQFPFIEAAGVAVDGQHVYWPVSDYNTSEPGGIGRANLDGTNPTHFIPRADAPDPIGVAVDGQHVYWGEQVDGVGGIGRANLDGTNPTQFFIPSADAPEAAGVAVDGQHVYWADRSGGNRRGGIGRANLDGTNPNQSFIPSADAPEPTGVAVDAGGSNGHGGKRSSGPPVIKQISPSGAPYSRPTDITLGGSGFRRGSKVYENGRRVSARDVKFVSSTELRVRVPRVRMDQSGQQTITVRTGHKTSDCKDPNQITCDSHFNYYVPQIGALVYYTGANDPQHGFPGYGSCTATIVRSGNQNTILTASHCVFDKGAPSRDLYFAPGYYGWLNAQACHNSAKVQPPPAGSAKAFFACGTAPYGVWKLKAYWTDSNNFSEANYDYAYAHVEERPGTSLEHAVGGGLPISFCPGQKESHHFMAGCHNST
jgi:hypothetical protein